MKTVSIILTIFNKEFLIEKVLRAIIENSSELVKEVVIVFDSCTDNSESIVRNILTQISHRYNLVYAYIDQGFETKSNNLGLKSTTCDYSILFQDDMIINEKDYDKRLFKPFCQYNDVLAVTARSAHNDTLIKGSFCHTDFFDKDHGSPRGLFGIRDVVNRGPLMVDMKKIQILNYFDEAFCPLTYDDHDLSLKAYINHGWVCGSFWTDFISNSEWGSTRQPSCASIITEALKHGEQLILERYPEYLKPENKHNEERKIA